MDLQLLMDIIEENRLMAAKEASILKKVRRYRDEHAPKFNAEGKAIKPEGPAPAPKPKAQTNKGMRLTSGSLPPKQLTQGTPGGALSKQLTQGTPGGALSKLLTQGTPGGSLPPKQLTQGDSGGELLARIMSRLQGSQVGGNASIGGGTKGTPTFRPPEGAGWSGPGRSLIPRGTATRGTATVAPAAGIAKSVLAAIKSGIGRHPLLAASAAATAGATAAGGAYLHNKQKALADRNRNIAIGVGGVGALSLLLAILGSGRK